jgi:hypothetical protein
LGGKLTKKAVEGAEVAGRPYFIWDSGDGAVKGFGLAIAAGGKKSFVAQYRIGSGRAAKVKRVVIGTFGTWTVEMARDRARELIIEAEKGVDRQAENQATRKAADAATAAAERERKLARDLRMNRLAARFMNEHVRAKRKPRTAVGYRHDIAAHILPAVGRKDAREVTKQDVSRLHLSLAATPVAANRVIGTLSAIFGWAEAMDIMPETDL